MKSRKKAKDHGVNKGTLEKVIKHVLQNGPTALPELIAAMPGIGRRSISAAVSMFRKQPGILEVPERGSYLHDHTKVSIAEPFKASAEVYLGNDPDCVDDLAELLAWCCFMVAISVGSWDMPIVMVRSKGIVSVRNCLERMKRPVWI